MKQLPSLCEMARLKTCGRAHYADKDTKRCTSLTSGPALPWTRIPKHWCILLQDTWGKAHAQRTLANLRISMCRIPHSVCKQHYPNLIGPLSKDPHHDTSPTSGGLHCIKRDAGATKQFQSMSRTAPGGGDTPGTCSVAMFFIHV